MSVIRRLGRNPLGWLFFLCAGLAGALASGFAGDGFRDWRLDAMAHGWPYLAVLALLCLTALAIWQGWWLWAVVCLAVVGFLYVLLPGDTRAGPPAPPSERPLRLLSWNILRDERSPEAVRQAIVDRAPDVVVLVEVSQYWCARLCPSGPPALTVANIVPPQSSDGGLAWPHWVWQGGESDGVLVVSRWPIVTAESLVGPGGGRGQLRVEIDRSGHRFAVYGVHTMSPISEARASEQAQHFNVLAERLRSEGHPAILAGDFNATPWSPPMRRLLGSGLRAGTPLGHGTFPAIFRAAGLPIDHVLVSAGARVRLREAFVAGGSDHRGLLADVWLPLDQRPVFPGPGRR